ncbi:hypothetical protein JHK87_040278 [Glycine soja]|nr:hypothetical protein JHK87_040278 [Glycine soja]
MELPTMISSLCKYLMVALVEHLFQLGHGRCATHVLDAYKVASQADNVKIEMLLDRIEPLLIGYLSAMYSTYFYRIPS